MSTLNGFKGKGFIGKRVSAEPKEEIRRLSQKLRCGFHHMSTWGISTVVSFIFCEAMLAAVEVAHKNTPAAEGSWDVGCSI